MNNGRSFPAVSEKSKKAVTAPDSIDGVQKLFTAKSKYPEDYCLCSSPGGKRRVLISAEVALREVKSKIMIQGY
jgi:hypothetical protein